MLPHDAHGTGAQAGSMSLAPKPIRIRQLTIRIRMLMRSHSNNNNDIKKKNADSSNRKVITTITTSRTMKVTAGCFLRFRYSLAQTLQPWRLESGGASTQQACVGFEGLGLLGTRRLSVHGQVFSTNGGRPRFRSHGGSSAV